jgi:hypothetical protein
VVGGQGDFGEEGDKFSCGINQAHSCLAQGAVCGAYLIVTASTRHGDRWSERLFGKYVTIWRSWSSLDISGFNQALSATTLTQLLWILKEKQSALEGDELTSPFKEEAGPLAIDCFSLRFC